MPELISSLLLPGLAMSVLMLLSAFFSGSETSMFYLSPDELRLMRVGNGRERAVAALLSNPDRLLTAVLFCNLLVNMTYFAVSVVAASRVASVSGPAAAGTFSLFALALIILMGEVVPKSVAVVFRRRLSVLIVWPLAATVKVVDPIAPPLATLTAALRRAFWPNLVPESFLDSSDLERAIEASTANREVIHMEQQVLHNVLDLSEIRLEEAMRPRGSYQVLMPPVRLADLKGPLPPGGFIALRDADSDDVDRIIPLLDLSSLPDEHLESKAIDLVHLPWCATLADALQLIRNKRAAAVSVVNEHGETIGITTRDDLLDALLIPEADRAKRLLRRDPVLEIRPGVFHVEGITTLRHLAARLALPDYVPDEEENVTVAGLVAEELEHVPEIGESLRWRGYDFKVIEVSDRTVNRVLVERVSESDDIEWIEAEL